MAVDAEGAALGRDAAVGEPPVDAGDHVIGAIGRTELGDAGGDGDAEVVGDRAFLT
jgi:hypothetical protein